MIQRIRTSRISKVVASYLAIQMIVSVVQPSNIYALTGGPSQPEFNSFTPIGTSDMVNLSSGDFNYNIPIMDVGGYPLNLAYNSGVTMDQEASWVGLGWNLNVGQITRNVRGLPDDFNGDAMLYENNIKDDISIGVNFDVRFPIFGSDFIKLGIGIGVVHNNYNGITFNTSLGPSFDLSDRVSVGMQFGGTSDGGASVSPSISLTSKSKEIGGIDSSITGNLGITYDSQQGLSSFNVSAETKHSTSQFESMGGLVDDQYDLGSHSLGSNIQLNDYLTFTPRNALSFQDRNVSFSFALGGEVWGVEVQGQITAWASYQRLANEEKNKSLPAFGYENTENAIAGQSILDFNREKDRIITENTKALAPSNYTYDSYMVAGQGFQGGFRPYRSEVGNVYDTYVVSSGGGGSIGGEIGVGAYFHGGLDLEANPTSSSSGRWESSSNPAINAFNLDSYNGAQNADYEATYYKLGGDLSANGAYDPAAPELHDYAGNLPLKIGIGGSRFNRKTRMHYNAKKYTANNNIQYVDIRMDKIKRTSRENRSNTIQKLTNKEAIKSGLILNRNESFVQDHHTAGISALKEDGSRYIYGETAYNTKKVEATFAISGDDADCSTGLVSYDGDDNSVENRKGRDRFFNRITTPAYAHSYLLTSVLSKDYEDLTNDGPSLDDLGSYTKITYTSPSNYNWRVPMEENTASYNAGLNTDVYDQKGNYIYGEKELKYVSQIETKTHIAFFDLSDRLDDGLGVVDENGGLGTSKMKRLDKITLYTVADVQTNGLANATPIKTVHFGYDDIDENLCLGAPNAPNGKLTLTNVHFTYQNSYMGEYTPYKFNYTNNYGYNLKGYDVWGNFKENQNVECDVVAGNLTPTEFPYVEQNKTLADANSTAWSLESIELPSGGKLTVEQESDDYQFVQDRRAMQMLKIVGAGDVNNPDPTELTGNRLYNGDDPMKYLYIKLPDNLPSNYNSTSFKKDFIQSQGGANGDIGYSQNNLMYFRVLANMTDDTNNEDYDYVTGYLELDGDTNFFTQSTGENYAALPLKFQAKEGGLNSGEDVNPISKAGWYFVRKYLNRQAYGLTASPNENNLDSAAHALVSSIASITNIFGGPNQALKAKDIASTFVPNKSWVRLYEPSGFKLGGGIRVKKVTLDDQWDEMVGNSGNGLYNNQYGQEYSYLDKDGKSSGVATFEPNGSKENPFVLPIFDDPVKIIAPKESNYIEKPLGESFFPAAQVTYSTVRVKNLNKDIPSQGNNPSKILSKHATGEVITSFYTSRDYPTLADYTDPTIEFDKTGILGNFLKVRTRNHLTMAQGIVVHTNDMNGKMKNQRVIAEGQEQGEFISGVDYNYSVNDTNELFNVVDVVGSDGKASKQHIGVNYDMINDFRTSKSKAEVLGADGNIAVIPTIFFGAPLPVISIFPNLKRHESVLKMATTTKVIHTNGILKEKIAYDVGSRISTKNLAWDAQTGEVLLTEVDNAYDDKYYNLTYPANWYYKNTGLASNNINFSGTIDRASSSGNETGNYIYHPYNTNGQLTTPSKFLNLGDELVIEGETDRYWVSSLIGQKVGLIDRDGNLGLINDAEFKVIRSGKRNNTSASMASVTTRSLPFTVNPSTGDLAQIISANQWVSAKVLNASAVEYNNFWDSQCEFGLPEAGIVTLDANGNILEIYEDKKYNPYLYNVLGEYRAVKSYAYLAGRNNGSVGYHPRNEGFFETYTPFYEENGGDWSINNDGWTFASEVTKYSPYGAELENKDALDRYSAAIYDYSATLPTAVGSNATYGEIGFDGFESSSSNGLIAQDHFNFSSSIETNNQASLDITQSHTGKASVKVNPGQSLSYKVECDNCDENFQITAVEDACIYQGGSYTRQILLNDDLGGCLITSIVVQTLSSGNAVISGFTGSLDPNDSAAVEAVIVTYTGPFDNYPLYTYTICTEDPSNCSTAEVAWCNT